MRGNCYYTSEALYHLLGGKAAGWTPVCITAHHIAESDLGRPIDKVNEQYLYVGYYDTHWYLRHDSGLILDATAGQFRQGFRVPYEKGKGCGFLTSAPSKKAAALMQELLYQ